MPAYLIANITVHDSSQFARYVAEARSIVARFSGRYIIRAGASEVLEGNPQINRTIVIEFPTMQNIKDFYIAAPSTRRWLHSGQRARTRISSALRGSAAMSLNNSFKPNRFAGRLSSGVKPQD